jgi:glycosyltransferase involved in cell wall biosynthesis
MVASNSQPLVSVLTPVYNGDKYLNDCIESVLSQTYDNWEYVIVNNCSTDHSLEIAKNYAKNDERIRIHNNTEFLDLINNWNLAINQISPQSKYCKIVHADDFLFPECIERMVKVAELNSTISIVGSYVLKGNTIVGAGLPYPSTIVPGNEICRLTLLKKLYVFGSPTSLLIRSDFIDKENEFYNESFVHADKEVCFKILQNSDFGFVHQILSFTRLHAESQTETVTKRHNTRKMENICLLMKYGPIYFNKNEYNMILKQKLRQYYRFLAKKYFKSGKKSFLDYQRKGLRRMGYSLSIIRLYEAFFWEVIVFVFNPKRIVGQLVESVDASRNKKIKNLK